MVTPELSTTTVAPNGEIAALQMASKPLAHFTTGEIALALFYMDFSCRLVMRSLIEQGGDPANGYALYSQGLGRFMLELDELWLTHYSPEERNNNGK